MDFVDVSQHLFSSLCRQNRLFLKDFNMGDERFGCIGCICINLKLFITSIYQTSLWN